MKKILFTLSMISLGALAAPERIVSTSGNASETIAALGLADKLVGVDTTSIIPVEIMEKKPKVGYRRQLSTEGILSLAPDLVILAPDSGPPAVIEQLKEAGVPLFYLQDKQTLAGIAEDSAEIGKVLEANEAAEKLLSQQKEDAQELAKTIAAYPRPPRLTVLIDPGQGQLFGLGEDSAGGHLAKILGADLSLKMKGRRPLSAESLATDQADAVLIAARLGVNDLTPVKVITPEAGSPLALHPATARNCVFAVNIVKALGFGPETAKDANAIAKALTPCLSQEVKK